MSIIKTFKVRVLYFFHHPDCHHCRKAEPILEEWKKDHKTRLGFQVHIIKLDLSKYDWIKSGFRPRMTPAYQLEENGAAVANFEGMLGSVARLDKFVKLGEHT